MTQASKGSGKRARRAVSAEFKVEAVRLMRERQKLGVSVAQLGRELDVRLDLLWKWAGRWRSGRVARGTSSKNARRSSRKSRGEVRLPCSPPRRVSGATRVSRARGGALGLLRGATPATECTRPAGPVAPAQAARGAYAEPPHLWGAARRRRAAGQGEPVATKRVAWLFLAIVLDLASRRVGGR